MGEEDKDAGQYHIYVDQVHAAGAIVATPGALDLVGDVRPYIRRHLCGDWGRIGRYADTELTAREATLGALATGDDGKLNVDAIRNGGRTLSVYDVPGGGVLWVMTEGLEAGGVGTESTNTCAMLPDDY